MEEIERKVKPYVVLDTTEQAMQCIGAGQLKYDDKIDDQYLSEEWQNCDCEEPQSLGIDRMAPGRNIEYREKPPVVHISLDSKSPIKDELFTQKPILAFKKNKHSSTHSVVSQAGTNSALLKTNTQIVEFKGQSLLGSSFGQRKETSPLSGEPKKSGRLSARKQSLMSDAVSNVDSTEDNARGLNIKLGRKQRNQLLNTEHSQEYYQS